MLQSTMLAALGKGMKEFKDGKDGLDNNTTTDQTNKPL